MLDQLPANKGPNIGILKYIVETVVEIFSGCLAGRQRNTAQQRLSSRIVVCGVRYSHGIDVVGEPVLGRAKRPSGEKPREGVDHCLIVGGEGLALQIADQRSVRIEPVQPNCKELQNFPSIVFIRISFGVIRHVQVIAHGGIQGNVV